MTRSPLTTAAPLMLRLSSLGYEHLTTTAPTPGPAPSSEELVAYIRELTRDAGFREAVEVSSTSLADMIDRLDGGSVPGHKQLFGAAVSLTRYLLRITGRPTPFGLLAGVAPLRTGPGARFEPDTSTAKDVRLDAGWLNAQTQRWLGIPAIRHRVQVAANNLCRVRGDRLVLPVARADRAERESTIRNTSFVTWVISRTDRPTAWKVLLTEAEAHFPAVPADRLDSLLLEMVRNDFLLTSLSCHAVDAALIARIHDALRNVPEELENFRTVTDALDLYAHAPLGAGSAAWRRVTEAARTGPGAGEPAPAQVDLRTGVEASLPRTVVKEIERYAGALWDMTPVTTVYSHMREYREAFMDKYGDHGAVPLPELVDPHLGLGYPRGYTNPPVSTDSRLAGYAATGTEHLDRGRLARLARLIQRGMLSSEREITLDAADVAALTVRKEEVTPLPLELTFQLLAGSSEHLDAADFKLVASPVIGSATAGAAMGRFAALTGMAPEVGQLLESSAGEAGMVAQIMFRPRIARAFNVTQVQELLPYEIPVGQFHDPDSPRHIDFRQLLVAADGSRLRIVHGPTGQEVHPVSPHMLNLEGQAPNLARFLAEIKHSGEPQILQIWDWSGFGSAPWLPRVRLGKVVLSPLTWRPSPDMREAAHTPVAFDEAVERWRAEAGVDDAVSVVRADNSYEIDLRDPFHRELLRRDIAQGPVKVTESVRSLGSFGWSGGRANEIVVPLLPSGAAKAGRTAGTAGTRAGARTAVRPTVSTVVHHPVGGEWLYAQLIAVPQTHDEVLCAVDEIMRKLSDTIEHWHVVRYFTPEPHLRLRVKTHHAGATGQLLQALGHLRTRALLREVRLCPYEPEVTRYGGPAAMDHAEQLFCLDSQIVAAQLALLTSGRGKLKRELLATGNYAMLLDALDSPSWPAWVGPAFEKSTDGAATRTALREIAGLVVPGETAQRLGEFLGMPALRAAWTESGAVAGLRAALERSDPRARRRTVLSLLHMQHNRLIGVDRDSELKSLVLLGHVARAHTDRIKHLGTS